MKTALRPTPPKRFGATARLLALAFLALFALPLRAQTLYVSLGNGAIDKVDSSGTVSLFATLPNTPFGLVFDGGGNLYAAGFTSPPQVIKITPGGTVSVFATLPAGNTTGIAIDGGGNLYVAYTYTDTITKVDSGGTASLFATLPAGSEPVGLAFDGSGNLYAANVLSNTISKITTGGTVSLFATLPGGSNPYGLAFDAAGNLYAANYGSDTISKIDSGGAVSLFATLPAGSNLLGLVFDGSGSFYVVGDDKHIYKVTSAGTASTFTTFVDPLRFGIAIVPSGPPLPLHQDIYITGDPVPGAGTVGGIPAGAVWKNFGPPSINASGTIAFKGTWTASTGNGTGIFAGGVLVAKVGSVVLGLTGKIATLKDPVIDDLGHVAFPGTLTGPGITSLNDSVVMSNALGVIPFVKAQEGTQAPDAPVGALWKGFTSVSVPSGGQGVLILGFMQIGPGGITATNDRGVWSTDSAGALHLVLQENTTMIGTRTVQSFTLLTTLSGTPGQTHAFNNSRELVSLVIYTDGSRAIVHTNLP